MTAVSSFRAAGPAVLLACAALLSACTTTQPSASAESSAGDLDQTLAKMLALESNVEGEALDAKLTEASAHPLGSKENPVRAQGPAGQRAYLSRLRCSDTSRPAFYRAGSAGASPYGNIVDVYVVNCTDAEPGESEVYIDMYHRGHVETKPVPGYGIVAGRRP